MRGPDRDRSLQYNIYGDPNFRGDGGVWGGNLGGFGGGPPLFTLTLDDQGSREMTRTLYFEALRPRRQIVLPLGAYVSDFRQNTHSRMEYGYDSGNNCNDPLDFGRADTNNDNFRALNTGFSVTATVIEPTQVFGFSKAFDPDTVGQGGTSRLTFTIDGSATVFRRLELTFTDNFPDGMVVAPEPDASTTCTGGTVSATAGGTTVGFSDGTIEEGETCTVAVNVRALLARPLDNKSGDLTAKFIPGETPGAEARLTVVPPDPPGFARVFSPDTIPQGGETEIVFTVDNGANAIAMTEMAFDDSLPSGVSVADTPGTANNCGGTFSPVAGDTSLAFTGGVLAAGATCELWVTVRAIEAGTQTGREVVLTSSIAMATTAEATLTVGAAEVLGFAKSFSPDTIDPGEVSMLTFTINNAANLIDVGGLAFDDDFPAGMVVAAVPNVGNSCGGTVSAPVGGGGLSLRGGAVVAEQTCTLSVDVRALRAGTLMNESGDLTSDLPDDAPGASATLTVNPAEAPVFSKAFSPARVGQGEVSRLTFTIDNAANLIDVGGLAFDDDFPDGMIVAVPVNVSTTCGGTQTAVGGGRTVSLSGGAVVAEQTCMLSVDVRALRAGTLVNESGDLTSDVPDDAPGASATLAVDPAEAPDFARVFAPATIEQGGETEIVFTVDNGANAIAMTEMAFDDSLPSGVSVADTPGAGNSCGGTFSPVAGATTLAFTGGVLAAGARCEIRVTVRAIAAGTLTGPDVDLTSSIATATAAEATLTVEPAAAPGFARVFSPDTIPQGGETEIVFTVDNGANTIAMTGMAFDDALPSGVSVADTPAAVNNCGGTFSPVAGATTLAFTGGVLAAGATCELRVTVRATGAGTLTGPEVALRSSIATATAAEATLTVDAAVAPGFARVFLPDTIRQGGETEIVFTVDNGANAIAMTGMAFDASLPSGVSVADTPGTANGCGGTFDPAAGATTLAFTGGALAAGATCELRVTVRATGAGTLTGQEVALRSSIATATAAEATLTVVPADAPGFSKAFSPATVDPGGVSMLTFTIDNVANAIEVGSLAFTDDFPDGMVVADTPNAATTCGGTLTAPAGGGTVALSGGTVPADAACTVTVQITSTATATNVSGALTSDAGNSGTATDTLTVTPVAPSLLSFTKRFGTSQISAGDNQTITFTIAGPGVGDFFDIEFTDNLSGFLGGVIPTVTNVGSSGCGFFSSATTSDMSGELILTVEGATLTGDSPCTVDVEFTVPAALPLGDYTNTTSELSAREGLIEARPVRSPAASDTMRVSGPTADLAVTVTDTTDPIVPGASQVYTVQVTNNGPRDAPAVVGTFTLPAGTTFVSTSGCAEDPDGLSTCTLGNIAALDSASYTVTATIDGSTTGTITASATAVSTATGPAVVDDNAANDTGTADTEVTPVADISVTNDDGLTSVDVGGTVTYRIVAANNGPSADPSVRLTDTFPPVLTCSYTSVAGGRASGNTAAGEGDLSETLSLPVGGEVAYTAICTVDGAAGSTLSNTATVVGSLSDPDNGNDSATDGDTVINPVAPGFAKSFSPATIDPGGVSTLTFTIDNTANLIDLGGLAFDDDFPADMVVAAVPNVGNSCGGTVSAPVGGGSLSLRGGAVVAEQTCTLSVDVRALRAGTLMNESGDLTSDLPDDAPGASATLTVNPAETPGFAKAFSPARVGQGEVSTLTFTIDNTDNTIEVGSLAFTDDFPEGMVVAVPVNVSTTCGGTQTAVGGGRTVSLRGGAVVAEQTCMLSVDVRALRAGTLENVSGDLTSDVPDDAPGVSATLAVDPAEAPDFARVFAPATIEQGGETEIVFTVDNGANAIAMTEMAFDDSLPSGVSVADTPAASNGCGGTFSPVAGATRLGFSDGTLAAGARCEIRVRVRAIAAGTLTGPDVDLTSSIATATAAEATLTVEPAAAPGFAKAFSPATVDPGEVSTLTFTIDNTANAIEVGSLAFTDTFPDGLAVAGTPNAATTCGGSFAPAASAASLAFTGGRVVAGQTCTVSVDVQALAAGALTGTSSELTSDLPVATSGALATLTVNEAPLSVSMSFAPPTIDQGGVSRLTYVLRNGAAVAAVDVALSDRLPADVVLAPELNADNGCGGFLSATPGGVRVSYSRGSLGAGATCTIAVDVTSAADGSYLNGTESATSSLGTSTVAEATLTVGVAAAPGFAKAFSPDTIDPGEVSTLTFTIDNAANLIDVGGLAFTDAFPDGLAVAGTPNAATTCGGSFAPAASAASLAFTGGRVVAGQSCTISVDVQALAAGALTGTSSELTSDLPVATSGALATLTVNEAPLSVSMSFAPPTIDQGGVSRLTYVLRNGAAVAAADVALSDRLPADVVLAPDLNADNGCGGFLSATPGGVRVSYSRGSLGASATCTIAVDVTSAADGSYLNGTESATSSLGTSTVAEATLTVGVAAAPGFAKAFSPDTIDPGEVSTLTFTIDNAANLIDVGGLAFTDAFPDGLAVAGTPNAATTCGGSFAPAASAASLAFTGGRVVAGQTCTVSVDVQALAAGALTGTSSELTSDLPVATSGALATLTVNEAPLSVSMSFAPPTIDQGGVSRLTYVLRNGAAVAAVDVALSDRLPADVVLAPELNADNGCGGFLSATPGGVRVSYSRGSLGAGATCTIAVDVTSAADGSYLNGTESATSSLGTSTVAEATLTVGVAAAPGFAKAFSPDTIDPGEVSTLTFTIDNAANLIDVGGLAFTDAFPDGLAVAGTPNAATTCGGSFAPAASAASLAFTGGRVVAGQTCTVSVDVQALAAGALTGTSSELTSDLPVATSGALATLTVNEAPLSVSMSFAPPTIDQGGVSRLTYVLRNGAAVAAVDVALSDRLPADVVLAPELNADNGCGGFLSATPGGVRVSYSRGSLGAGATCTIAVDVTSAADGSYLNGTESATSSLGTSTVAEATLTVGVAAAPGFAKAFSPDTIDPGEVSTLTFTIDNAANLIDVGGLAFTDAFPDGLAVAGTPNAATTCGGSFAPAASAASLAFTGGRVVAGQTCTISVDVQALAAGALTGTSSELTSDLPVATSGALATLTVNEAPLSVSMSFAPPTIDQGGVSRLTYVLRNGAAVAAADVALSDSLPADVVLAPELNADNGCGGFLSATPGGVRVSYSRGSLGAGATCTIAVDVTSAADGSYLNGTESATSSLGTSTVAEATLTVGVAAAPGFAKAFSPDTIDPGEVSTLTFTIDNAANLIDVGGLAFTDAFPDGLAVAGTPNASTTCGGSFAPAASATSLAFTGGRVVAEQSCAISVDVVASRAGALTGTSGDLTSDLPVNTSGALATLTVNEAPLSVSMSFVPPTIDQGGVSRLTYRLDNGAAVDAADVALSDRLPADVVLAPELNADNGCGGFLSATPGGVRVSYSRGSLGAGAACTIAVDVTSAAAGSYLNGTESATSSLGTSTVAEATLTVDAVDALGFAKAFSPVTIDPGEVSTLTFTIDNAANLIDVGGLAFTDAFPDGLAVAGTPNAATTCGGSFAPAASAASLAFTGGRVVAGQSCTISVDVVASRAGALTGTSGDLTSDLPVNTSGASATLTVNEAPLSVSMSFEPTAIGQGGVSRLTYMLDNGAAVAAVDVALLDRLPADVVLAPELNADNGCGGFLSATPGGGRVSYSRGSLGAGATCTIAVDVTSAADGSSLNGTESATSSLGTSTVAEATLTVGVAAAPGFAKAFSPDTIDPGEVSTLTFTIDNAANLIDVGGLAFTDAFPDGLAVAGTPNAATTCGGSFAPAASAASLAFTGGRVVAGQSCTISVDVQALAAGALTGTSSELTSDLPVATSGALATLTVNEAPLSVSMSFAPTAIGQGGVSRLTYMLDNGAAVAAADVALLDRLPADVVLAPELNADNGCGGFLSATPGGVRVSYSRGSLGAGGACTIAVDVTSTTVGSYPNDMESVTSSLGDSIAAEATLTVDAADAADAPRFAKMFDPDMVDPGGISRLTYMIDNAVNAIEVGSLAFTDAFRSGLAVAPVPNLDNRCRGVVMVYPGDSDVILNGGAVAAGQICTISVDVVASRAGELTSTSGELTSDLPDAAPGASATLTVNEGLLSVSMSFEPTAIGQGGVSRLTYVLRNGAAVAAADVALLDRLPADVVLAPELNADNGCGGFLSARPGGGRVSYSRGLLAAGATCTIAVDVTSAVAGSHPNGTERATSSLGASTVAEATLTVEAAAAPGFARVFSPDTIPQGGETEIVFTVDNGANTIAMTGMAFDDSLPSGVSVADTPGAGNSCGGTFSPVAGATTLGFSDGTLAAGARCEIRVTVRATGAGTLTGSAVDLTSSIATATTAEATLTVASAVAPDFAKTFSPATVDPGEVSTLTYRIDNTANAIEVGSLTFTDDFPDGLAVAPEPNADNSCGGTFAPAASATSLVFSGGLVAAGGTCTLAVDVQALVAGTLTGTSGDLTSDLPVATPGASASLMVNEAPLSVSMSFSPSTIGQGGVSRLTYGLNNGAPVAATSVALSDRLPAEVVLAGVPNAETTCAGGTLTAAAGGGDVSYSGGSLAAGGTCTIAVDVTSAAAGSYLNGTESVTSSLGTSAAVEAMLTVYPAGTVTFNVESDTDGIFNFSSAEPVLTVSLEVDGGTGSTGALVLATGRYSVAVAAPTGVALTAIACDDTDSTADVSAAAMISVTVDASEAVTCTLTAQSSVQPTVEAINSFLTRRADLILSSESDPHRRFERLKRGSGQVSPLRYANGDLEALVPFTVQGGISFTGEQGGNGGFEVSTSLLQVRQAAASAALASGSAGDVAYVENYSFGAWFEAQYKQFGGGSDEHGDFAIAYFGMDYLVKPDVLVGALVSLDTMEEVTDTSTVSGFGYMIGPYVTARLASYLYFDGHVAVGRSDNRISPFNTYTDSFRTGRWLARGSLTGEARHGNWTIRPHARLGYFEETQQRYTDSVGATIPSQTVRLGQLKIGPTFTGRFEGPEGWTWAPYLEVEGIYNIGDTTGVTLTDTNGPEVEGWRARLKAGVGLTTGQGTRLSLGATHDGLGRSDFENWGLKFELSIPFGKP